MSTMPGNQANPRSLVEATRSNAQVVTHGRFGVGERIAGTYLVRAFIGRGSIGEAYKCIDENLGVPVAVQIVDAGLLSAGGDTLRQLYLEGARRASSLQSDAFVSVRHVISEPELLGIVMDLVEGPSLSDFLETYGPLPFDVGLEVFLDLAEALLALHEAGKAHGAISPREILIEQQGDSLKPRLKGFDRAALASLVPQLSDALGAYRAPELLEGQTTTPLGDIFALGATLYEALGGHKPGVGAQIDLGDQLPEAPESLVALVRQMTQHAPSARFQSLMAVRNVLKMLLRDDAITGGKSPERPDPGDIIAGQYVVDNLLGEGGMARVYLASDKVSGVQVAVKLLSAACVEEPEVVERFLEEASIQAKLVHPEPHPNIVAVHRVLTDTPVGFVMEFVPGVALDDYIRDKRPDRGTLLELFAMACDGLHHAHAHRIVHRDLKPSNILVSEVDGELVAKLMDFGISKQLDQPKTKTNIVLGTIGYLAPELFVSAKDASPASDIYAIGCCLYEGLTGDIPFPVEGGLRTLAFKVYNEKPAKPSDLGIELPFELEELIMTCLAKKAEHRPPSAAWIRDRLRAIVDGRDDPVLAQFLMESATVDDAVRKRAKKMDKKSRSTLSKASRPSVATLRGQEGPGVHTTRDAAPALPHTAAQPQKRNVLPYIILFLIFLIASLAAIIYFTTGEDAPPPETAEEEPATTPPPETEPPVEVATGPVEPEGPVKMVLPATVEFEAQDLLKKARAKAEAGETDEAIALYQEALEKYNEVEAAKGQKKEATEAMAELGELYEAKGELGSASDLIGKAAVRSKDYELFMKKAEVDQERGDALSALNALNAAAENTGEDEKAKDALDQAKDIEEAFAEGSATDDDGKKKRKKDNSVPLGPLPPNMIDVWIESKPKKAKVYYKGRKIGNTPMIKRLPKSTGTVTFTLKRNKYYDDKVSFDGQTGGRLSVKLKYRPPEID